jgi:hypothetical protein
MHELYKLEKVRARTRSTRSITGSSSHDILIKWDLIKRIVTDNNGYYTTKTTDHNLVRLRDTMNDDTIDLTERNVWETSRNTLRRRMWSFENTLGSHSLRTKLKTDYSEQLHSYNNTFIL